MFRQYRKPERGENIIAYADLAVGGGDYCACQFFSKTKLDFFMVYHARVMGTEMTNMVAPVLDKLYDQTFIRPIVAFERNNGGAFEMERIVSLNRLNKYEVFRMPNLGRIEAPDAVKYGVDITSANRGGILGDFKEAIDKRLVGVYDKQTIDEMFSFIVARTSTSWKAQAESKSHDDLIMSAAGAYFVHLNTQPVYLNTGEEIPDDTLWASRL